MASAVQEAWTAPFIGNHHHVIAGFLRDMYRRSLSPNTDAADQKYLAHTTIIQSSGSGKSRLVDEIAKTIFTIPFNIRDKSEDKRECPSFQPEL